MRILVRLALAFVLICLFGSGQAVQVVRYAQQTAGSATGELFVEELSAGPLKVRTPSHPGLHIGIKRMGDRSLIRLVAAGPPVGVAELKVVLKQGDSEIPFRIPLAVEKRKSPPGPGSVPVLRKPQEPGDMVQAVPAAERQAKPVTASAAPALTTPGQARKATEPKHTREKATVTAMTEKQEKIEPVCPYLVVRKGSLMENVERLIAQCGYRMGTWYPGNSEDLVDWIVKRDKHTKNSEGVTGLLAMLEREYNLTGVMRTDGKDKYIDFYESGGQ